MKQLRNIHPGEVLQEEFLASMQITAYRLSKATNILQTRISEIIKGNRRVTLETAVRLSFYFATSAKFWLALKDDHDIEAEQRASANTASDLRTRFLQLHSDIHDSKRSMGLVPCRAANNQTREFCLTGEGKFSWHLISL